MRITLYINTAENNRLDKTSYLERVIELEGTLRDSSSLLTPTILMELPSLNPTELIDADDEVIEGENGEVISTPSEVFYRFNYVYISEFERYYYVQDINIVRNGLMMVSLIVDVLMSFRDNILSLDAYVDRNEYDYDDLLVDDMIPLELSKGVTEITPDRGEYVTHDFSANLEDQSYCITITITGFFGSFEVIEPPEDSGLPIINDYNISSSSTTYIIRTSDYGQIMNGLMGAQSTYRDYILSVIAYPFNVDTEYPDVLVDLAFGNDGDGNPRYMPDADHGGNVQGKVAQSFSDYLVVADFTMPTPSSFLDLEPFTQYELYIPFYGWTKLDYDLVKGHRLLVYYATNRDDGSATAYVWDYTSRVLVYSTQCQLGVKLGLSSSNQEELTAQKNAIGLNLAVGLVSSALSIGVGVGTSNPVMVAGGALSATRSITSAINSFSMLFPRASASFGDSASGMYVPLEVRLRRTSNQRVLPNVEMSEFRRLHGAPLRQIKPLSNLRGFTIVSEIHLENINAFKREKEEIVRLLQSGVIL